MEDENIRRVSVSVLENEGIDKPISVIEKEVRKVLSTGVSEEEAEQIVTSKLQNSIRDTDKSSIEVYSIPDNFKGLFIDPQ